MKKQALTLYKNVFCVTFYQNFNNARPVPVNSILQFTVSFFKYLHRMHRVNLLLVGESQRVPALDLPISIFLKSTSFLCCLSNVSYSLPNRQFLSDLNTGDACLYFLQTYSGAVMLSV